MAIYLRNQTEYAVVIDTIQYAGNFEREMCAYITGRVGDCEVGDQYIPLFMEDFKLEEQDDEGDPFWDSLDWRVGDDGCPRPVSIYDDAGNGPFNSVIIFFQHQPTKDQLNIIKQRAESFSTDPRCKQVNKFHYTDIKCFGVRVIKIETKITDVKY